MDTTIKKDHWEWDINDSQIPVVSTKYSFLIHLFPFLISNLKYLVFDFNRKLFCNVFYHSFITTKMKCLNYHNCTIVCYRSNLNQEKKCFQRPNL